MVGKNDASGARKSPCIMCVQYIGGCSVHRGDIVSTSGDVQYIRGYHEYMGGCSVHRGFQYKFKGFCYLAPPHAS